MFEILVAGAGTAGLVAAIALAQSGFATCLVGPLDTRPSARTVALLDGSVRLLENLGLWDAVAPDTAPLAIMRLVDDTGSLFAAPPVDFCAAEIGLEVFGHNIETHRLVAGLADIARKTPGLELVDQRVAKIVFGSQEVSVTCEDGAAFSGKLLVAADGRDSLARRTAPIPARTWSYPQMALTAVLAHARPHHSISTEFHTRAGPCTFVPLPATADEPHRSSLVWMMGEADAQTRNALEDVAFARAVERQAHMVLGTMQVAGARGKFPMAGLMAQRSSAKRLALVGEAAHVFPPIGAQGLNLGLRDVADLVDCLTAVSRGDHPFDNVPTRMPLRLDESARLEDALSRFDRLRRADIATRSFGVDALNRSLLSAFPAMDFLRGAGLVALAHLGPLRRAAMRAGIQPGRVATLMRPQPANSR